MGVLTEAERARLIEEEVTREARFIRAGGDVGVVRQGQSVQIKAGTVEQLVDLLVQVTRERDEMRREIDAARKAREAR